MMRIPLFQLQAVLFPGEILGLRVFESRYLDLIAHCLEERSDFGVVLIREGPEAGKAALPEGVGTVARIIEAEELEDGHMHVLVAGVERFRLRDPQPEGDLPSAVVERFPEELGDPRQLHAAMAEARQAFQAYASLLSRLDLPRTDPGGGRLPDLPLPFSYRIAAGLRLDPREKQELLEAEMALVRIRRATSFLERETRFLSPLLQRRGALPN